MPLTLCAERPAWCWHRVDLRNLGSDHPVSSSDSQLRRDLETLRTTLDNTTSNTKAELQALASRGELGSHRVLGWSGTG